MPMLMHRLGPALHNVDNIVAAPGVAIAIEAQGEGDDGRPRGVVVWDVVGLKLMRRQTFGLQGEQLVAELGEAHQSPVAFGLPEGPTVGGPPGDCLPRRAQGWKRPLVREANAVAGERRLKALALVIG